MCVVILGWNVGGAHIPNVIIYNTMYTSYRFVAIATGCSVTHIVASFYYHMASHLQYEKRNFMTM